MKIFLDDKREFPSAQMKYNEARTFEDCIELINYCCDGNIAIEIINLDYDLGTSKTGLDVLKYLHNKQIIPESIIIHSTHVEGEREMVKYIKQNFKESKYSYCPALE